MKRSVAIALWEGLRPNQWTKNLFLFAGLIFSRNLAQPDLALRVLFAFAVFCLLSGVIYLWNDLIDLPQDRRHPIKSRRPLASGRLQGPQAIGAMLVLFAVSLWGASGLGRGFFLTAYAYFLLQALYLFFLKHWVILDVFAIAGGFLLRVVAGAVVIDVEISSWLLICTIFLSLFIALGKRRQELMAAVEGNRTTGPGLVAAGSGAIGNRQVLGEYNRDLLDQMISVVTASTVLAYALYTQSEETIARFGTRNLIFTLPFVLYGVFRYLYLIHQKGAGEEPEMVLLTDKPLLVATLLWVLTAVWVIYGQGG